MPLAQAAAFSGTMRLRTAVVAAAFGRRLSGASLPDVVLGSLAADFGSFSANAQQEFASAPSRGQTSAGLTPAAAHRTQIVEQVGASRTTASALR